MRFFKDNVACRSPGDQCKSSEEEPGQFQPQSQSKRSQHFNDVWYRQFLKPMSRSQVVPYRESFKRRVLRAVGIPVAELQGVHEAFKPSYRRYSPLHGMTVSKPEASHREIFHTTPYSNVSQPILLFSVHLQQLHQQLISLW
jgi:hypothetical protein